MSLYQETQGTGPAVVLLHGWGLHSGVWSAIASVLAQDHRVTAVDLPGFGRSRVGWRDGMDLDQLVTDLLRALPQPAAWVGWSLGGLIALAIAARAPAAVSRLVLIGTTPRFVQTTDWSCAMPQVVFDEFSAGLDRDVEATLTRFLGLHLGQGSADRALLRELRRLLDACGLPEPTALRGGLRVLEQSDLRLALPSIDVPALVLHGRDDRLVPATAAAYLVEKLPQARAVYITGAGHAPFLSQDTQAVDAIKEFLH